MIAFFLPLLSRNQAPMSEIVELARVCQNLRYGPEECADQINILADGFCEKASTTAPMLIRH